MNPQSHPNPNVAPAPRNAYYKTKLCPYFVKGNCLRGNMCSFAHGRSELRSLPNAFKNKICYEFQRGSCHKNPCNFSHNIDLQTKPRQPYVNLFKTKLCSWFMNGSCSNGPNCKYAHGEHELRKVTAQPSNPLQPPFSAFNPQMPQNNRPRPPLIPRPFVRPQHLPPGIPKPYVKAPFNRPGYGNMPMGKFVPQQPPFLLPH